MRHQAPTYQDLVDRIEKVATSHADSEELHSLMLAFVRGNEDVTCSPNYASSSRDAMHKLLPLLEAYQHRNHRPKAALALTVLKILSRKRTNRQGDSGPVIKALVAALKTAQDAPTLAEAANVLLNLCYEAKNVELSLAAGAAEPLAACLTHADVDVRANAAGAVQSVCFQKCGRLALRDTPVVQHLLGLLDSDVPRVRLRAVGALHNISSDPAAIRVIRRCEGIPKLVQMLFCASMPVAASAAGTIQNLAREVASRMEICKLDCVGALTQLLVSGNANAQVCAAGALLNILGPTVTAVGAEQRKSMCQIMGMAMSLAIVHDTCFEQGLTLAAAA